MKTSRLLFCLFTLAWALLVLSGSIAALLLLARPFFAAHVALLDLSAHTPWTAEQIREGFGEMMDFCLLGTPFGTGVMHWSPSGMAHFSDCARLFRLDFLALFLSVLALAAGWVLYRRGARPARPLGRSCTFWAGLLLSGSFLAIGLLAALDFDRAFVVFHRLFFPSKSNWLFDPATDEIIRVLPQVFFRNCAIAIAAFLVLGCAALILSDLRRKPKKRTRR